MTGRFVVVGTPIGNLEDVSPRAARSLAEASLVCCEDTRRTRKLFSALSIPAPRMARLDRHTEAAMAATVLSELSRGGSVVLVSDAGMPAVSDPGDRVTAAVAAAGHTVEVVPGPTAVSAALAVSGLPASQYRFAGFLPRKGRERTELLSELAATATTVVIFEAPARVAATVDDLATACGPERSFVAARELTKLHEQVWRGNLGGAQEWLKGAEPKGEWVLLLGPLPPGEADRAAAGGIFSDEAVAAALVPKLAAGLPARQAVAEVAAALRLPKRRVYAVSLSLKRR